MKNPPANIAKKRGKRIDLQDWLARELPAAIGEREFEELLRALAPVSKSYLRRMLRDSAVELAPMVEGVRQDSFDHLERSLRLLAAEYQRSGAGRRASIRQLVITAKDHARWAARRERHREEKNEMALWMLTWLENPPLFEDWIKLRRIVIAAND